MKSVRLKIKDFHESGVTVWEIAGKDYGGILARPTYGFMDMLEVASIVAKRYLRIPVPHIVTDTAVYDVRDEEYSVTVEGNEL